MRLERYRVVKIVSTLISLLLSVSIILFLQWYRAEVGTDKRDTPEMSTQETIDSPVVKMSGVELTITGNEGIVCRVKARKSEFYKLENKAICFMVTCMMQASDGSQAFLRAPRAEVDQIAKTVIIPELATGTFKQWTWDGEQTRYDGKAQKIFIQKARVRFNEGVSFHADECIIDIRKETIVCDGGVTTLLINSVISPGTQQQQK